MKGIIRKDNVVFVLKVFGSFLGFIITNFSLIQISQFATWYRVLIAAISLLCLGIFLYMIYGKYAYYRSFSSQLRKTNSPLYLICTYLAKTKTRNNDKKNNNFNIDDMEILYNIEEDVTDDKAWFRLSVTYDFLRVQNGMQKCSKIYWTSLSSENSMIVKYSINNENFSIMRKNSYYDDMHCQLWEGTKTGQPFGINENFSYSIKVIYNNIDKQIHGHRFLIDPSNYGNSVRKINIKISSSTLNVHEIFKAPESVCYYNGLNTSDVRNTSRFHQKSMGASNYFELSIVPAKDEIYVVELFPKQQ